MTSILLRLAGALVFGLVIFITGYSLTRGGKPYPSILFNVHKLVALAAVVLFALTVYRASQAAALSAVQWILAAIAGLAFVNLFVTGALLSIDRPAPEIVRTLHHLAPYVAAVASAASLLLLGGA